jgi:hypothetical protein
MKICQFHNDKAGVQYFIFTLILCCWEWEEVQVLSSIGKCYCLFSQTYMDLHSFPSSFSTSTLKHYRPLFFRPTRVFHCSYFLHFVPTIFFVLFLPSINGFQGRQHGKRAARPRASNPACTKEEQVESDSLLDIIIAKAERGFNRSCPVSLTCKVNL